MARKSFGGHSGSDDVGDRPLAPPILCTQCLAIFKELSGDGKIQCPWCWGGGPFQELDQDVPEVSPQVSTKSRMRLKVRNSRLIWLDDVQREQLRRILLRWPSMHHCS